MADISKTAPQRATPDRRAPRLLRLSLAAVSLALVLACGFLWMRYGAQVFLDAALFAWRACF